MLFTDGKEEKMQSRKVGIGKSTRDKKLHVKQKILTKVHLERICVIFYNYIKFFPTPRYLSFQCQRINVSETIL